MQDSLKYCARLVVLVTAAAVVATLGFRHAAQVFAPSAAEIAAAEEPETSPVEVPNDEVAASVLAASDGSSKQDDSFDRVEDGPVESEANFVEVVSGVNMRSGPGSEHPVIEVARRGEKLRVASRQDGWVEVIASDSGQRGWVYGKYVQPVIRESHLSPAGAAAP